MSEVGRRRVGGRQALCWRVVHVAPIDMIRHGIYSDGNIGMPLGILGSQLWPDSGAMQTQLPGWSQVVWSSTRWRVGKSVTGIHVVDDDDEGAPQQRCRLAIGVLRYDCFSAAEVVG